MSQCHFWAGTPMHYHPQISRNKYLVRTHMHSMNQKLTNEHVCTNIGIHSPPNIYILIPELKYYLFGEHAKTNERYFALIT